MTIDDIPRDNDALKEMFLSAACPTIEEFDGIYKVVMLTGFPLRWNRKIIANSSGINRLLFKRWGHFHLKYGTVEGMERAVLFDYDQKENGRLIRPIRDYVRKLDDGLYLGAFNYVWRGRPRFVGYFLLIRAENVKERCETLNRPLDIL